ncbi:E3 ubiquitin-protein ligase TRIM39-like [Rhinoraja longicauda]
MPNCLSPLMKYRCWCGVLAVSSVWLARHRSLMIFTPRSLMPFTISTSGCLMLTWCGHNFCRSCITQSWDREERNSCPECREEFTDRTLRVNRALARLAEKARTLSLNQTEKESKLHCEEHQEELKLFCETDKKLICLVCAAGREHKSHSFMPVKEAVENHKDQVKSSIRSLTKDKSGIQQMEQQQKEKISGVLLLNICRVGVEAKPQLVVDGHLLLEKFETPFLYNTVLAEASDAIKQVSVTLDVETAHARLEVSEDRKRVRRTRTERRLPDTGKRFTDSPCVLGSEGFTSGRHYWEVEVAGSEDWSLGVAAESVDRKGWVTLAPETGVWSIWRVDDEFEAFTSPRSPLPARPIPGRVGVYLSYESGTVSFYDAATKSHLHTFTGNKFTGKLYPFFGPWDVDKWVRICSGSAPGV